MGEKAGWEELSELHWHMCIMGKLDGYWEATEWLRELSSVFCVDPEGWDGVAGGRPQREGTYVYIQLIHTIVQQKIAKHCKATLLFSH